MRSLRLVLIPVLLCTPLWGSISIDSVVSADSSSSRSSIATPSFFTAYSNELLLAFIATDGRSSGVSVMSVTGAGLSWGLVQRTNVQLGTAEIWRAFAPTSLSGVSVTASLSQRVASSITVISFIGADTSGANGSGAIGATGSTNAGSGAPAASLVTTRNNSWVFGVGNDWDNAIPRTAGANQTIVHQYLASVGDTYWVQRQNSPTPLSGTSVTINDSAPTTDRYNLSMVEVLPALASAPGYTISGTISGIGGNGARVSLTGGTTATVTADSSGNYSFSGLANGSYTITASKTGFSFTPASLNVVVNNGNVATANFSTLTYSISGTISGSGGNGATVTLSGASSLTLMADAGGNYLFSGLANGTYTITPSNAGFAFSPSSQTLLISNMTMTSVNFSTVTYGISGTISGSAAAGAAVNLTGTASSSVTANSSGSYSFSGLANGSYTVTPSDTGVTFTPANQAVTLFSANVTGVNFSASAIPAYSIQGTVSPFASGVTVTLTGAASATTSTNASGSFSFNNLGNGSYTVTASEAGVVFTPASQTVTVSNSDINGVNFVGSAGLSIDSISVGDNNVASSNVTTNTFSTTGSNELLLAFIASDGVKSGVIVQTVTGGSLTWSFVTRTNTQMGTAEIWRALAQSPLTGVSITASLSQSVASSVTVVSLLGVDASGTNGAGAIGAIASANAGSGAPSATLLTTRNGSWVFGVGNDWDRAVARTVGSNQTLVHQFMPSVGDTYWVQRENQPTSTAGSSVSINDTAPTSDRYNLTIVEVLPATGAGGGGGGSGVGVSISPTAAVVNQGGTQQFIATVTGSSNTAVNWSVTTGSGSIGASGLFAAPSNAETDTVQVQSQADTTKTATAAVTVPNVAVNILPLAASVNPGATQQFTATVTGTTNTAITWSTLIGTITSTGLYTAPSSAGNDTVTATAVANGLQAKATVTIQNQSQSACGNTLNWTSATCQTAVSGALNTAIVNGVNDPNAWTIISRHGEYAQNETECNGPWGVSVANGALAIGAFNQTRTCGDFNPVTGNQCSGLGSPCPGSFPYSTGDVQWSNFNFEYGVLITRQKVPSSQTNLWPGSGWLLTAKCQTTNKYTGDVNIDGCPQVNWNGYNELDMSEFYNGGSGWPHFNLFTSNGNENYFQGYSSSPLDTNWHTYATVWTGSGVQQYVDDVLQVNTSNTINDAMFFIFQTQTGGSGGTPNNSLLPAYLYLDYVKVCNVNYTLGQCEGAATDGSDPNVTFYDDFGGPAQ